ncbi:MAG: hypothetical protein J6Y94_08470 [Bacteriovoracaceae bacterium]|nr:hypothetical protein [Bacteriovoracaceae bacterium]
MAVFPIVGRADFGEVIKVKGGTVQRINQSRRINNMLSLDSIVYEKDILRGDQQAMAVLKTGFGDWYLGKNVELQVMPNEKTLVEITHGQLKIVSKVSLHQARPIRVGDLEIQFMHKFGLIEEGEGEFKGGWLISGLAVLALKKKSSPVQHFELSSEEWLIHYHVGLGQLQAYHLKRPKFLKKENNSSFFADYREIYANEVFDQIPFAAVTPTPVPAKKIIRAPEELRLSEGQDQKVNLTGDPDLFLENYYQLQLQQKATPPAAKASKAKKPSTSRNRPHGKK